jgi:hypothetical protein
MSTIHRRWVSAGLVAVGIGALSLSVCAPEGVSAYEYGEEERTPPVMPDRPAPARAVSSASSNDGRLEDLEKQLNNVLKHQEETLQKLDAVMERFDAVMEELRIIKVRATLRGSG